MLIGYICAMLCGHKHLQYLSLHLELSRCDNFCVGEPGIISLLWEKKKKETSALQIQGFYS